MSTHRIAAALALLLAMAACTTGPDFTKPASPAPDDWTRWRSADESLRLPPGREELPERWWEAFGDPVLNQLQEQAVMGSPDLRTAALHFVQARVQRGGRRPGLARGRGVRQRQPPAAERLRRQHAPHRHPGPAARADRAVARRSL